MGEKNEKTFENFSKLFDHLRMTVVNKMKPDDRCRFSGTSTWCLNEARSSKNYIYAIKFLDYYESMISIQVLFKEDDYNGPGDGYRVDFCNYNEKKYIKCQSKNLKHGILWKSDLDNSANILELALDQFKKLLQLYQASIKKLVFGWENNDDDDSCDLRSFDFEIENLKNLEALEINTYVDIKRILLKVQRPLKELTVLREENASILEDFPQIYQVKKYLMSPYLKLNAEHFEKLSAPIVYIHIGELTEQDIARFIRSWQTGEKKKNLGSIHRMWNLERSNFDLQKLGRLLGVPNHDFEAEELIINHHSEKGRTAELTYYDDLSQLSFDSEDEESQQT